MKAVLLALALASITRGLAASPGIEPGPRNEAGLQIEDVSFDSHGVTLAGSIVLPAGDIRAAVVFVHGSGPQARSKPIAMAFAREGIAALVYDKRGAGRSGGVYEANQSVSGPNIRLLADDAGAAVEALSRHPRLRGATIGLAGISQAGWIAPITAAARDRVKFLVMWSGPVCRVSEEDIYSKYTHDSGSTVPAYAEAVAAREQPYVWPAFLGRDTDSSEDLDRLSMPGLWIFSDNDASVPVDLSLENLRALRRRGHRYDYALFSGLGHDNLEATLPAATAWIRRTVQEGFRAGGG